MAGQGESGSGGRGEGHHARPEGWIPGTRESDFSNVVVDYSYAYGYPVGFGTNYLSSPLYSSALVRPSSNLFSIHDPETKYDKTIHVQFLQCQANLEIAVGVN
jgi:hypothetical protein